MVFQKYMSSYNLKISLLTASIGTLHTYKQQQLAKCCPNYISVNTSH